ncbi:alpha/beta hydrolase family protein [Actinomadura verrucosospora]|uniref:Lipase n=1 Tax=Actinomadura verrucosospora TaxID=46165 RepID=A0A7D3ZJS8_ACTVE|nr:lipase [Actinomadura verrucosospora]QKG20022.1 lipase [Actinomadura verrucosospora]
MRSRRLPAIAALLALPLAACGNAVHADPLSATAPAGFTIPAPTGPGAVGTVELHLVDGTRRDPWVPSRPRELMVSVWYPVQQPASGPAPYLRPGVARVLDQSTALGVIQPGTVDWAGARTHAADSAPAGRTARPVVLYSPGFGVPRVLGTTIAEELVSRGYVVVTMDHTYETAPVEFPGGRVESQRLPEESPGRTKTAIDTRVADTRFVLDRLAALTRGRNPDAEGRPLPHGLARTLDLSKVGLVGHSAGGVQAAEVMRVDRRVHAGINMDGTMQYGDRYMPVARTGLDRPFMLMGAATGRSPQTHRTNPSWGSFWTNSTGWKRDLNAPRASHYSYTDVQAVLPALDTELDIPAEARTALIGTVDPTRMTSSLRAYVTAFFDHTLRGRPSPILNKPSPRHPDIHFIR